MFINLYRFGIILSTCVVLFVSMTTTGRDVEGLLLHVGSRFMHEQEQVGDVVAVVIDDESIREIGDWPWSRTRIAEIIDRLAYFEPTAIGLMLPLTEPETASSVAAFKQEIEALSPELQKTASQWLQQLDTDAVLARALDAAGNVVLTVPYSDSQGSNRSSHSLNTSRLKVEDTRLAWQQQVLRSLWSAQRLSTYQFTAPIPLFLKQSSKAGLSLAYEDGQRVHGNYMAVDINGIFLPGFELALLSVANGSDLSGFRVMPGMALQTAGKNTLGAVDLAWYPHPAVAPPVYSVTDMMHSDSLAQTLANKVVVLGITASGLAPVINGPQGRQYTPAIWSAQVLASMLANNGVTMPEWFYAGQRLLLVTFALYLILIPLSWHGLRGLFVSLALSVVAINVGLGVLVVKNQLLPVVVPVLFLLITHLVLMLVWSQRKRLVAANKDLIESRCALAMHLQSHGQLDQALEHYRKCLPARAVLQPLYELGLDYERRRQIGKAQGVYEQLVACRQDFRDVKQRSVRLAGLSDRFPSVASSNPANTLVLDTPVVERPVLGRYQVERELGQGAMGTVYLAKDPTIGREVAIKTLPLLQEFKGAEQAAVAERFFQEAAAVGRLAHPNIVTVYDAGKEHDLAYIAMDYVPGSNLDQYTGITELLPVWEVLEITAQVAEALDYAHRHNVVHRDIKPANIMYDRDSGAVKITDFGIARLLDNSRTRTGTILGSPSYMSPEQIAGQKTDGQSDLFSLGITLYQLLSGSLPFQGDSMATLMYQIANQKTPPIRKVRSDLPVSISRLLNKVLQKSPAKRYQTGKSLSEALAKCRSQYRGGRKKTA